MPSLLKQLLMVILTSYLKNYVKCEDAARIDNFGEVVGAPEKFRRVCRSKSIFPRCTVHFWYFNIGHCGSMRKLYTL